MKNKFFITILLSLISNSLFAENVSIKSKNIILDKNNETSIFERDVIIVTKDGKRIKSQFAEYNKKNGLIKLEKDIKVIDKENNEMQAEYAEYDSNKKKFKTFGVTKIITNKNYIIESEDVTFDNLKKIIFSKKNSYIIDKDQNKIFLDNFEYGTDNSIFKSIGYIRIKDKAKNTYEFSQIYIDTNNKEILGTDVKSFFNDKNFKVNEKNKPRIFANTIRLSKEQSLFNKSRFTLCDYRENDKCPPWTIQASEMLHDNKKKTIFYEHAVVKVYDIPIFYLPKLSHPDPTVERRSGFLPPKFSDTKNLGMGISVPYFWDIAKDKNFTLTNRIFVDENPLFTGEYHQAFMNSNFLADFGFTEGYKKTSNKKKPGDKSHFFSKFVKNFSGDKSESTISISTQNVSNDKYLKLYKIESNLVDYNSNTLTNSINFTKESENVFFGFNSSIYETLNENYNDKYEYIFPEITIDKNLISNEKYGNIDLQTNYKVRKYDTNKYTNFLVNDLSMNSNEIFYASGFKGRILANIKNINYETKNIDLYKDDTTNELFGAIGYQSEIDFKKINNYSSHFLKPKILLRYAPGDMRKESSGIRLNPINAFSLDRLNNLNNFETGLSSTIGFDYKIKNKDRDFDFSVAQILSEKENKKMASKTSLDEKLSDLVASANFDINDKISFDYNFSVDQNYSQFNYNEISTKIDFNPVKINFNYLQEAKHIGDQEYFKTKINFEKDEHGLFSFETKRNLITNSSEFYNLSYEYTNDCLRAGLVYRREFYNDSELEPENSLMFQITLIPFGNINSPSFAQ